MLSVLAISVGETLVSRLIHSSDMSYIKWLDTTLDTGNVYGIKRNDEGLTSTLLNVVLICTYVTVETST